MRCCTSEACADAFLSMVLEHTTRILSSTIGLMTEHGLSWNIQKRDGAGVFEADTQRVFDVLSSQRET